MFFVGGNFVSSLIWTLKSKKPIIKLFLNNLGFFQPWTPLILTSVNVGK